jgi:hypothetical protein
MNRANPKGLPKESIKKLPAIVLDDDDDDDTSDDDDKDTDDKDWIRREPLSRANPKACSKESIKKETTGQKRGCGRGHGRRECVQHHKGWARV